MARQTSGYEQPKGVYAAVISREVNRKLKKIT